LDMVLAGFLSCPISTSLMGFDYVVDIIFVNMLLK
jgi:hypothetical protein